MECIDFHSHANAAQFRLHNLETFMPIATPFSVGIHPWKLHENWESSLQEIYQLLHHEQAFAVGEIGFDGLKGPATAIQVSAFQAQATLAKKFGLPILLHCVRGMHLLQAYLKKNPDTPPIIWHGWNLKPSLAASLLNYPIYFSFGKHLLIQDSNAQKWLKTCPLEKVFFETDNSSLPIESIYQQASVILGCSMHELAAITAHNWKKISTKKWYE
jgi:TatD DNase family protein